MCDWELAPRNAFKEIFPNMKIYGCWFHYSQRIWAKAQNLGLAYSFRNSFQTAEYTKQTMAIPFLSASLIKPTFNSFQIPELENSEMLKLGKLNRYCKKHWLNKFPKELSIYDINISTNNGAESYHSRLKSIVRTVHPRI